MIEGFGPIARADATTLILGTAPSVASLALHQYYGHPRNAFWRIVAQVYGFDASLPYAERVSALASARVAVWDVLASCTRPGSLDSAIEPGSVQVNDFDRFFDAHPHIARLAFNGTQACALFNRHVGAEVAAHRGILAVRLPSTSPAHAAMPFELKLGKWQAALRN